MLAGARWFLAAVDGAELQIVATDGRILGITDATELSHTDVDAIATQTIITLDIGGTWTHGRHRALTGAGRACLHPDDSVRNRSIFGCPIASSPRSAPARHREECHKSQDKSAILHSEEWSASDYEGSGTTSATLLTIHENSITTEGIPQVNGI